MGIEDKIAAKAVARAQRRQDEEDELSVTEVLLLRVKLEVRTWFLRFSLAANTGLAAGLIVYYVTQR